MRSGSKIATRDGQRPKRILASHLSHQRRRMIRKGKMAMTATSMVVYGAAKRRDFLLSAIEQCGQKLDAFEVNSMTEVGVQTRSDFGTQCA